MVRYNMVLDITRIRVGPKMAIFDSFSYITYTFYSQYNKDWIANTEIGLDPKNSVIKRLWCMFIRSGVHYTTDLINHLRELVLHDYCCLCMMVI